MPNLLFLCGRNLRRSPTAEAIFSAYPGVDCASAGVSADAQTPVSTELLAWADIVFVMEAAQRRKLVARFPQALRDKRIVCLAIPDHYEYMEPALTALLLAKVAPLVPQVQAARRRGD